MKKILFVGVLIYVLSVFLVLKNNITKSVDLKYEAAISQRESEIKLPSVTVGTTKYSYVMFRDSTETHVIQNDDKKDFITLTKRNACRYAINGSFYSSDYTSIGLVQINGTIISPRVESTLFDGFLSMSTYGESVIGPEPDSTKGNVLQSGPLFIKEGQIAPLVIQQDKESRRSIAFITDTQELYFASIFKNESRFSGPYLEELPDIVSKIADKEGIRIIWALNLDGGSASALLTPKVILPEFRAVKTIICIK